MTHTESCDREPIVSLLAGLYGWQVSRSVTITRTYEEWIEVVADAFPRKDALLCGTERHMFYHNGNRWFISEIEKCHVEGWLQLTITAVFESRSFQRATQEQRAAFRGGYYVV